MSELRSRRDEQGRAYVGSELQIQIYVNRYPRDLLQCLLLVLPSLAVFRPELRWVSPLESEEFATYKDAAFLKAVGIKHAAGALHDFWPLGAPAWDAMAIVHAPGIVAEQGVILIQAKSHPTEFYGPGCQVPLQDHEHINIALNKTKR